MKLSTIIFFLLASTMVFAEKVTLSTPGGNISMEIEGITSSTGSYESNVVIKNINKRLEQLNANYIVKLKSNDRMNAKQLLDEIKYLVNSIPQNVDISFGMQIIGKRLLHPCLTQYLFLQVDSFILTFPSFISTTIPSSISIILSLLKGAETINLL